MTPTLPDGSTITYSPEGRIWHRPEGDLLSRSYGPWEPYSEPLLPRQECPACGMEHPGDDCQQPDLFEGAL